MQRAGHLRRALVVGAQSAPQHHRLVIEPHGVRALERAAPADAAQDGDAQRGQSLRSHALFPGARCRGRARQNDALRGHKEQVGHIHLVGAHQAGRFGIIDLRAGSAIGGGDAVMLALRARQVERLEHVHRGGIDQLEVLDFCLLGDYHGLQGRGVAGQYGAVHIESLRESSTGEQPRRPWTSGFFTRPFRAARCGSADASRCPLGASKAERQRGEPSLRWPAAR